MGQELLRLHPQPAPGGKREYRTKTVEGLAKQLPYVESGFGKRRKPGNEFVRTVDLWLARKLASRFGSWSELQDHAKDLRTWHVLHLLSADERKVEVLRDRCVHGNWSEGQLKREIQNDRGRKSGSGGRPNPRKPATAAIAVQDLLVAARRWIVYHDQCLSGRKPILKHARRASYSPSLLRDVENAVEWIEQVQKAVEDELKQLRDLAKNIKSALKE